MENNTNIQTYLQRIKKRGFRLTKTRTIVLDTLLENQKELTAGELFFLSHKKYSKIGMATIYRNIKLLEEESLIKRAGFDEGKAKYRIRTGWGPTRKKSDPEPVKSKLVKSSGQIKTTDILMGNTNPRGTGGSYRDVERINIIQGQLNGWLNDLNEIKEKKELELEDVIKDFGTVDKIINNHDNQKSNLIQMLLDVQNEYRWLPKHILLYIGSKLDISLTDIYGITTFYKYFNLEPIGKHSIIVCMGTACHVRGAMNLLQRIVNILGVKPGDTTGDYKFTLDTVNCLGCCALGPVMMIDNKYFSNPSTGKLKKILNRF